MKATILSIFFAFVYTLNVSAQESFTSGNEGNNELKVNLFYVVLETVELDYERILNQNFSVGLAANYWFNDNSDYNFMALPYFRFYPSDKLRASGFFIEGNMAVIGYDQFTGGWRDGIYTEEWDSRVGFGGGIAAGGKFMSKSGFFGEVFGGVGRIFHDLNFPDIYPRAGISIGKRF